MTSIVFRSLAVLSLSAMSGFGAAVVANPFDSAYTLVDLGSVSGVDPNYGGLTFLNTSTLLLGANANSVSATIQAIAVNRDGNGHITSFGSVSQYATAPYIDGGLTFGPGGVLFATSYSNNTLMQYLPGSTAPDKIINLPAGTNSTGTVQFVAPGNPNAGSIMIGSFNLGGWSTATMTPDGNGTFDLSDITERSNTGGGPEGLIDVGAGNPLFSSPTALVSEYNTGAIRAYELNSFGAPVAETGVDFVTGLTGAEGAMIDPVTGDFLFSTFGSGNRIFQVQGFVAPAGVPEPSTFGLLGASLLALGYRLRSRRR